MDWTCLLVDLTGANLAQAGQEKMAELELAADLTFAASREEAVAVFGSGSVLTQVIFAKENGPELQALLKAFQTHVGCLTEFQAIVCDEPDPALMAGAFEFGIEQFFSLATWPSEVAALTRHAAQLAADPSSAEAKTLALSRSIKGADQSEIKRATENLGDLAEYDYRAAFAKGKAAEAQGDYNAACDAFSSARGMNKMFRPSASSLGETLLVTGKVDEALDVFKQLEKTNPYDFERKANLAAAYIEKGDFAQAQKYVDAAEKLAPGHSKILEAKAQVLLCTGKVGDAFKLMDGMSDVGPFFAAKLNELGIQLSQAGKGKSALALYQKAHKIVRSELRYKISLNAALACRRLQAWDMALKYAHRCEKEFGASFPKLEKIKETIRAAQAQAGTTPPSLDKAG